LGLKTRSVNVVKKLVEVALPLQAINTALAKETGR
jgi:hypothetical protein